MRMIGRINSDKAQAYADRKRAAMNRAKKLREDRHALDSTFGTSEGTMGMCWEKGKERSRGKGRKVGGGEWGEGRRRGSCSALEGGKGRRWAV